MRIDLNLQFKKYCKNNFNFDFSVAHRPFIVALPCIFHLNAMFCSVVSLHRMATVRTDWLGFDTYS